MDRRCVEVAEASAAASSVSLRRGVDVEWVVNVILERDEGEVGEEGEVVVYRPQRTLSAVSDARRVWVVWWP
jgi:hypothetical protein